jgi:hypothetical protein
MWEANARTTLSTIIANLRQVKPNCESMVSAVSDLAAEIGRQNLFRHVEPGDPSPMMNQKAVVIRAQLENLEAALSEGNVLKSVELAEVALRLVG